MPTSPDAAMVHRKEQRERSARRMMRYLDRIPMPTEARLELALKVLRSLPEEATPDQTLEALRAHLPEVNPALVPPSAPPFTRGHMPGQDLDRRHIGVSRVMGRWFWVLFPTLLLALTLLLTYTRW